jgi:glycosyltransferase involved in cell wall biosynthesis
MLARTVTVRVLPRDEALATPRDAPSVCLSWSDQDAGTSETLAGIVAYTPPEVPIVLVAATEGDLERVQTENEAGGSDEREIWALAYEGKETFAQFANAGARAAGASDLVIVAPGVAVGPEWLERLQAAVRSDSTVVSATALGDDAGALSVVAKWPTRQGASPVQPAAGLAVSAGSPRAYPRIACAGAHCVYLRRALLERLGGFDTGISDPDEAIGDLSLRSLSLGMVHVAADDVFVLCPAVARPARSLPLAVDLKDERAVLRRSLSSARIALHGMSVTIDARALAPGIGGTQQYTIGLILALASSSRLHLRVVIPPDLPAEVASRFDEGSAFEIITYEQAVAGVEPSDIVHRPQQVFSEDDLRLLHLLGERVVVGQQDLIAYRNPAYHETLEAWQQYRRVTRLALAVADRVVFFSEHARRDAVGEDLVNPGRCDVAGIGADVSGATSIVPVAVADVPLDRDMIVCLGADYRHKNRPFAIALLDALRRRHGWQGCLVLAGTRVPYGSSRGEELELLADHPDLAEALIDVGPVSEAQKTWLFQKAQALVYPTLYEGFGLIPFEAAHAGLPCLFAPQASLVELAGPGAATLIPWDPQLSADAVMPLLVEGPERQHHLRLLLSGTERAGWSDVVDRLLRSYERTIIAPQRASAPRAWQELERERYISDLEQLAKGHQRAYRDLRASVGIGLPLVAEGGLLSRDEQRGLMRVASRRSLHSLMLTPVALLGRVRVRSADTKGSRVDDSGAPAAERDAG